MVEDDGDLNTVTVCVTSVRVKETDHSNEPPSGNTREFMGFQTIVPDKFGPIGGNLFYGPGHTSTRIRPRDIYMYIKSQMTFDFKLISI